MMSNQYLTPSPLTPQDDEAKTHALIANGMMLVGLFTLVFWFVGGIWAMVKKSDVSGSRFDDHFTNLITVFWWGIFWALVGGLLSLIFIGYVVLFVAYLWALYRLIKGLARLTSNRAFD
jgi:uncharacterized membrane protein